MARCFLATRQSTCKASREPEKARRGYFSAGGLFYPVKNSGAKKINDPMEIAKNGLAFQLTAFFRYYGAEDVKYKWGGEPMPEFGEPAYETVAEFMNATWPQDIVAGRQVERRVNRLRDQGVRLANWFLPQ